MILNIYTYTARKHADIIIFAVSVVLLHKFESGRSGGGGGGGGEHLSGHARDPFLTGNYF